MTSDFPPAIDEAAPIAPAIRSRFGLTALEACLAIREARQEKAAGLFSPDGSRQAPKEGNQEPTAEAGGGQGA